MSGHSMIGLIALNLVLLVVGIALLFALRGFPSWTELLRLSGLAYMLGVAAVGVAFVLELVVGLELSLAVMLATGAALFTVGIVSGRVLGRRTPAAEFAWGRISLPASVFGALTIVYSAALFRSGRLSGLYEFDGWLFWVPKAKAIYFFGGLDQQFFHDLPNQSYPPLVPALEATAFRFMGSPDVVTLHLQFWFLLVGFLAALVGILTPRVPALLLWPPILLLLITPHVVGYALQAQADFLLDELFALGALLAGLWLVERRAWQLSASALLLAAAMLTKREGYFLTACVATAALAVTWRQRRTMWPRLLFALGAAVVATVPWRVFLVVHDLSASGPETGGTGLFANADRAWPSFRLAISTLFDFDIWLVVIGVALLAVAAGFAAGARQLPGYALLVHLGGVAGLTWATWAFPSFPITKEPALNPIIRLTGSLTFVSAALVPLLLATAWRGARGGVKA